MKSSNHLHLEDSTDLALPIATRQWWAEARVCFEQQLYIPQKL